MASCLRNRESRKLFQEMVWTDGAAVPLLGPDNLEIPDDTYESPSRIDSCCREFFADKGRSTHRKLLVGKIGRSANHFEMF